MQLTQRQIEVLRELASLHKTPDQCSRKDGWATPRDFGGGDDTHHGETAKCLVKRGLVDRIKWVRGKRPTINNLKCRERGSCGYKINATGLAWLKSRVLR